VRGFTLFCFAPTAPPPPAQNPICCRCYWIRICTDLLISSLLFETRRVPWRRVYCWCWSSPS
jgi:hypothetical protein